VGALEGRYAPARTRQEATYYQLTAQGRRQLRVQMDTWTRYARAVSKVLQTA